MMSIGTSKKKQLELTDKDRSQLRAHGISVEEASRQIQLLKNPPYYANLDRPCTIGDGIHLIDDSQHAELIELYTKALLDGRFSKFVPASGAATRMFKDLLYILEKQPQPNRHELDILAKSGSKEAKAVVKFLANLNHMPFFEQLKEMLQQDINQIKAGDNYIIILEKLLMPGGLNYAELPKGLLPFHLYEGSPRTSFEEHIVEAAHLIKDIRGKCRLHFTVSPEHLDRFHTLFKNCRSKYEKLFKIKLDIEFSLQKKSTDMLALAADGSPFYDESGNLMLRPGGHGALIENLIDLKGDLIFIKNIDNVQPDKDKTALLYYKKILAGFLLKIQSEIFENLRTLNSASVDDSQLTNILNFIKNILQRNIKSSVWLELGSVENKKLFLINQLNKPLRVCGMVRNTGEPGGGPFWVREGDSTSAQIVEGAQVDQGSLEQASIFNSSSHFNPVDLVCSVKDFQGNHFDLKKFINQEAIIKTNKSYRGRSLIACERPGLWNGSMGDWNTLFVDVPESTFTPVKSVLDFLRK